MRTTDDTPGTCVLTAIYLGTVGLALHAVGLDVAALLVEGAAGSEGSRAYREYKKAEIARTGIAGR